MTLLSRYAVSVRGLRLYPVLFPTSIDFLLPLKVLNTKKRCSGIR